MTDRLRFRAPGSPAAILLLSLTLVGATACTESSGPVTDKAQVRAQLIEHERTAWKKYIARDLEGSRPLLAADYADVQTDGSVLDRDGHLAYVPKANVEWHELDRFNVILLAPDAAVVTYRVRARDHGATEVYQADVNSGWSLRDARWMNTFYRETPTQLEAAATGE